MLYEVGLCASIAIGGWLFLDLAFQGTRNRRSVPLGLLGLSLAVWAGGELLIRPDSSAAGLVWGRRVFFLGACALPSLWFWAAAQSAEAAWYRRRPWMVGLVAFPQAVIYSSLYWDDTGLFLSLTSPTPLHGPLFDVNLAAAWLLTGGGLGYFAQTAFRLRKANPTRMTSIALAIAAPLAVNALYLAGLTPMDTTAIVLGGSALLLRAALIESGLTLHVPVARSDVINQLDVGIAVADLQRRIVDANPKAMAMLGAAATPGSSLDDALRILAAERGGAVEVRSIPLRTSVCEVGSAVVLSDRSWARDAERRLQLAARLETVGSLTAGIAHEVNNPLAFIRANLSHLEKVAYHLAEPALRDQLPEALRADAAEALEIVAETQDGVDRISGLVQRLKAFARDEADFRYECGVNLRRVASKAVALASVGSARDAIRVEESGPTPEVWGNENDLVQIVLNLVINALQARPDAPDVRVEVASHADGAVVRVLDRGPGIAPEAQGRIFDPFFTTKGASAGSGLGLSVSRELAEKHGGRLDATNRRGGGAVFSMILPSAEDRRSPPGAPAQGDSAPA